AVTVLARRALKVRSSIYLRVLSVDSAGLDRDRAARPAATPVVGSLVLFNEVFHPGRIPFSVPVTEDRGGPAAGFDQHVGEDHAGLDLDRRDVRHVDGLFETAEPARPVLHHA